MTAAPDIAARLAAATPGPWTGDEYGHHLENTAGDYVGGLYDASLADAALIVHAAADLAVLLAENATLAAENAALRARAAEADTLAEEVARLRLVDEARLRQLRRTMDTANLERRRADDLATRLGDLLDRSRRLS